MLSGADVASKPEHAGVRLSAVPAWLERLLARRHAQWILVKLSLLSAATRDLLLAFLPRRRGSGFGCGLGLGMHRGRRRLVTDHTLERADLESRAFLAAGDNGNRTKSHGDS